jgi:hypothetical protein
MKQYTITKQVKISKEQQHYLDVLKNVYKINPSSFIRIAMEEKLKRDIKELRKKHKEKNDFVCPF